MGTQAHPEFKSRPDRPHPLFRDLIGAALKLRRRTGCPPGPDVTSGFRHLGDRQVHEGHIWRVVVADFESPDGRRFQRDIVRSPGAVAAVPLVFDAEGNPSVVLVRQYRPAYDRELLEIPAGMRDVAGERDRGDGAAGADRGGRPGAGHAGPAHRAATRRPG